jgi:Rrf2 family protein
VRADEIASKLDVPRNYLSKILHELARTGLLSSTRGRKGGFCLGRSPSEITLLQVVEQFESFGEERACFLGQLECSDGNPCAMHGRWSTVRDRVDRLLEGTTLLEVAAGDTLDIKEGHS